MKSIYLLSSLKVIRKLRVSDDVNVNRNITKRSWFWNNSSKLCLNALFLHPLHVCLCCILSQSLCNPRPSLLLLLLPLPALFCTLEGVWCASFCLRRSKHDCWRAERSQSPVTLPNINDCKGWLQSFLTEVLLTGLCVSWIVLSGRCSALLPLCTQTGGANS